jgi:uncharacterized protein (TIGR00251 family)
VVRLAVHVAPKSGRDEVTGWNGTELSVRVTAPPEGGKANAAVCRLIAARLGVPKSAVTVARGDSSRHKSLEIVGADEADIVRVFAGPDQALF